MNFQRNQVSWTVARILSEDPSPAFERDIAMKVQRLIDRDRATETASSHTARAFLEEDGPGKGTVVEFSEEAVFLLLLGVLFLESGLTQSRVIRLIRDLRAELCEHQQWDSQLCPNLVERSEEGRCLGAGCPTRALRPRSGASDLFGRLRHSGGS